MSSHPTEDRIFEVAVLGAGPAGATAARLLSQWGHSVALVGRSSTKRTLAESLPPSCTKLFDQLGMRETIDAAAFVRATGNTVRWAGGEKRIEQFAPGLTGYQVARDEFDALLLTAATAQRGLVYYDATAIEVVRDREGVSGVAIETATDRTTIRARWVLDCTGRAGIVARHGWRRPELAARTMAVVGVWERGDEWPVDDNSHTLVESYDGGWAWSVPVSSTRRYVTVMIDPELTRVPGRAKLADAYAAEVARTMMIDELVVGATMIDGPWGSDASPYSAPRVCDSGILLVGDAASFVDPLSSFGVKKALVSSWLASVVVHTTLIEAGMTTDGLALFADRERAMFEQLQGQSAALARDAAGAHATEFWSNRSVWEADGTAEELDGALLRRDQRIGDAFEELKRRPVVRLRIAPSSRVVGRASVRGNRVVLEPHLTWPQAPLGARYCRNIDLVCIAELSGSHDQVPDLYDAYCRARSPVPLPDFLAVLSALVGFEVLTLAD